MWPKSKEHERLAEVVQLSNENEGIELTTNPEITKATADQKAYFDQLIESNDAIEMCVFMGSLEHGVQTNLYNSFSSEVTKYKRLVDELLKSGRAQLDACQEAIEAAAISEDEIGALQLIEDLSEQALASIRQTTDDSTRAFMRGIEKQGEAA
jgi:hypothetical protein